MCAEGYKTTAGELSGSCRKLPCGGHNACLHVSDDVWKTGLVVCRILQSVEFFAHCAVSVFHDVDAGCGAVQAHSHDIVVFRFTVYAVGCRCFYAGEIAEYCRQVSGGFGQAVLIEFYNFTVVGHDAVHLGLHIGGLGIDGSAVIDFLTVLLISFCYVGYLAGKFGIGGCYCSGAVVGVVCLRVAFKTSGAR